MPIAGRIGSQVCADTWASGAQGRSLPTHVARVLDACHIPTTDTPSCQRALESGREEGGKGHSPGRSRCSRHLPLARRQPRGVCSAARGPRGTSQGSPPSLPHSGMKGGTQTASRSGTVTMLLADTGHHPEPCQLRGLLSPADETTRGHTEGRSLTGPCGHTC